VKNELKIISLVLLTSSLTSCSYRVKEFTEDELKWQKPFDKTDTVIFISENNELDTIIFYKTVAKSHSVRSLERGFYDENYLTVRYEFSSGSYHQSARMSDGGERYTHHFVNMVRSSSDYQSLEITFIGTFFSGKNLDSIQKIDRTTYFFESVKGNYAGVNVEEGIRDFTFDSDIGITNYTDKRNIKWRRK